LHSTYSNGHALTQIWIEGVGTNKHPFYPNHNMYSFMSAGGGVNITTDCVYQNGVHIFGGESCEAMLLTETETYSSQNIVFSPNPFATEMTISSAISLQNATLKLYNLQGQLIREINSLNGQKITINRENLIDGFYFVQLFENNKLVKSGKMMVD
jgi:hypothetical protein